MSQYTPLDNDSDCVEFEAEKVEKMEVEFEVCDLCRGEGIVALGGWWYDCRKCQGCGEVPIEREG